MSLRVCLYALALGVGGGLVFSVVPAWRSARLNSQSLLLGRVKSMARLGRLGGSLVGLQVALTVVLVFGAVLVTREFVSVLRQPLWFDPGNVLTVLVVPDRSGSDRQRFYLRAMEAVAGRPDVAMVGATSSMPMGLQAADEGLVIPGLDGTNGAIYHALPGFFEAAAIPLVRGRLITPRDLEGNAESAVVGESLARVLDPGGEALGATFQNRSGRTFRVVGVVGDVAGREMPAYVIPDRATRVMTLLVRANRRTGAVERDLRREMSALAPGQPVSTAWWSDSIASRTEFRKPRFQSLVLGGFGSLALALTAVGIFAVVAFAVASRRREMGVRMAVGAEPRSLVRTIVRQSLTPVVMGLAAGLVATVWVGRLAQSYLLDVELRDPLTLAWTGIAVVVASLVASYLPARRASRIDPVSVLRVE
jgi:putative ABC transport system permease protein